MDGAAQPNGPAAAGAACGADVRSLQMQLSALVAKVAQLETHIGTMQGGAEARDAPSMGGPAGHSAAANSTAGDSAAQVDSAQQPAAEAELPAEISMSAARVVMHEIVLPHQGDFMSICFGGQVLSWIDICAGLAAKTVARGPCVTASVDAVHFLAPLRVGSVAIIAAMVNRTFTSSMEVGVRVEEEDMRSGQRTHCVSAYLTFVAVSAKSAGPMMPRRQLPRIVPTTLTHQTIHAQAEERRVARLAARKAVAASPERQAEEARMRLPPVTHRTGSPTLAPALQMQREGGAKTVPPGATSAHMTQLIMPQHANSLGITFGGQVMRWMEQAAYIAASRVGRGGRHLLTAGMDSIAFRHPTRVGDILYVSAQVTSIFGSSMEVLICVDGESPRAGGAAAPGLFHCGSAFATVVSVAGPWPPVAVPVPFQLKPETDVECLRCQGAARRRADRLEMRRSLASRSLARRSLDGSPAAAASAEAARLFGQPGGRAEYPRAPAANGTAVPHNGFSM